MSAGRSSARRPCCRAAAGWRCRFCSTLAACVTSPSSSWRCPAFSRHLPLANSSLRKWAWMHRKRTAAWWWSQTWVCPPRKPPLMQTEWGTTVTTSQHGVSLSRSLRKSFSGTLNGFLGLVIEASLYQGHGWLQRERRFFNLCNPLNGTRLGSVVDDNLTDMTGASSWTVYYWGVPTLGCFSSLTSAEPKPKNYII